MIENECMKWSLIFTSYPFAVLPYVPGTFELQKCNEEALRKMSACL